MEIRRERGWGVEGEGDRKKVRCGECIHNPPGTCVIENIEPAGCWTWTTSFLWDLHLRNKPLWFWSRHFDECVAGLSFDYEFALIFAGLFFTQIFIPVVRLQKLIYICICMCLYMCVYVLVSAVCMRGRKRGRERMTNRNTSRWVGRSNSRPRACSPAHTHIGCM